MRHIEDLADAAFSRGIAGTLHSSATGNRILPGRHWGVPVCGTAGVLTAAGPRPSAGCSVWSRSTATASVRCAAYSCNAGTARCGAPRAQGLSGSLMGLALKREALGDILLPADAPGTAYVFALEPAAKLICRELCQAGRTEVSTHLLESEEIPAFPAPERAAAHRHCVLPAAGRGTLCHAARQPRHRCGADRGGQGRDQPSAGGKTPCSRIRAGCVHRARQGPLPADCIAREK